MIEISWVLGINRSKHPRCEAHLSFCRTNSFGRKNAMENNMDIEEYYFVYRGAIIVIEDELSDKNKILEFDIPDGLDKEVTFLRIKFRVVIGSLTDKEEFLLKKTIISYRMQRQFRDDLEGAYYDGIRTALANRKWSVERTYKGVNPLGIEAGNAALKEYKSYLERCISFDDAYAEAVQNILDLQEKHPDHPLVEWGLKYIRGNNNWATSR